MKTFLLALLALFANFALSSGNTATVSMKPALTPEDYVEMEGEYTFVERDSEYPDPEAVKISFRRTGKDTTYTLDVIEDDPKRFAAFTKVKYMEITVETDEECETGKKTVTITYRGFAKKTKKGKPIYDREEKKIFHAKPPLADPPPEAPKKPRNRRESGKWFDNIAALSPFAEQGYFYSRNSKFLFSAFQVGA